MKCPNDNATLLITERNGIEIDYCPECRGVWLDRGELDKLIERTGHNDHRPTFRDEYQDNHREHGEYHENRHDDHHKKHRRENPLADFFDFG